MEEKEGGRRSVTCFKVKKSGWERPHEAIKAHSATDCFQPEEREWTHLKSEKRRRQQCRREEASTSQNQKALKRS